MALPHPATDWDYMLEDACNCFRRMIVTIAQHARVLLLTPFPETAESLLDEYLATDFFSNRITIHRIVTNDTWTRDYAPITVYDSEGIPHLLDFTFNGWGMKFAACHDNCVNRQLALDGLFAHPLESHKDMVLEGGSIDSDGEGHLLVTSECLLEPNRNPTMSRQEIEQRLTDIFGLRKVLWVDHGFLAGDDTDSHIDTLARFAPGRKIVYIGCNDPSDIHYQPLKAMERQLRSFTDADGEPFTLVKLPMAPVCLEENVRLPSTYANYLVLPNAVIMPSYGDAVTDEEAADILKETYGKPVFRVDCRPLVRQHGSLHCSTMQIPRAALRI